MGALMIPNKGGQISRDRSDRRRAKNRALIIKYMVERGLPVTAQELDLELSVARRELRDMADCNIVTFTEDETGRQFYTLNPKSQASRRWVSIDNGVRIGLHQPYA